MGKRKKKVEYWIQKAIKNPGSLRRYVKKVYGSRGFTSRGTIKVSILKKLAKKPGKVGKRARLALTLRRLATKKRWAVKT
ncbi:MAG: hypothetical protein MRT15_07850 [archaeon YNP-LCB-003-016]|uniref:hypothetical protein n=1 Tax=Candidatus Culexarchaeum yellowstonense TaxID=2928963 RepID=UPI0026ED5DA1|nr:hypothetical protein [Candidatus Culexarchaeum yellowstonense]MCR6692289.1 hypothetical protein [Candidatus Culexarchaeum yellowstonense]